MGGCGLQVEGCGHFACPDPPPELPVPTIEPSFAAVQVGGYEVFSLGTSNIENPSYQWQRSSAVGPPVDISGATGASYELSDAQLADDGAIYLVKVNGIYNGSPIDIESWPSRIAVSSMPPVIFLDSDFLASDWLAVPVISLTTNGRTHTEEQSTSGGHPGAFRKIDITAPPGSGDAQMYNEFRPASYDPAFTSCCSPLRL